MTTTDRAAHRLPGGWKLADHPEHGRVLVVRTFGDKAIYATPAEMLGIRTHVSLVSDLTFMDTDNHALGATDAVD